MPVQHAPTCEEASIRTGPAKGPRRVGHVSLNRISVPAVSILDTDGTVQAARGVSESTGCQRRRVSRLLTGWGDASRGRPRRLRLCLKSGEVEEVVVGKRCHEVGR
ncbi:hypothetical protein HYALB_00000805 [Hymenoscyphus albidus]|uniref:Uncharacterized protein n=1 Tax=Hymenoscyphus albidus TaxID=595503 RepID=A0A9N9LS28_9HELO|nr:hypothetical protein HYALB_00000805 [Hymenoscyphus albidus]